MATAAASLHILSPNGIHRCAGEYAPVAGLEANGMPVWRMAGQGQFWLYSGNNGMWIVGGEDANELNFKCSKGMIFNRTLHRGQLPHKVGGQWSRLENEAFCVDEEIRVTLSQTPGPRAIRVVSPNGQHRSVGEYILSPGLWANGLPVWRHRDGGRMWIYSGTNGSWIVGGGDTRERNFNCQKGVIYSKRPHGGKMPHTVGGSWMRLHDVEFMEDTDIVVSAQPPLLYVRSPHGQQRCAGEYAPMPDRIVNGQPIWEHLTARCWLYSGTNGMWIIGGTDAKEKDFHCTRGVIYCKTHHSGTLPDKLVGQWLRLEGDSFREDAAISVSRKPYSLYVVSPNGHQRCAGEYTLAAGETINGHPVWRQKRTPYRVYTSNSGTWVLTGSDEKKDTREQTDALVHFPRQHKGLMPDKMDGIWVRADDDGEFHEDPEFVITTMISRPARVHVHTPNGQQRCAGEYVLDASQSANGQPLWKQMGGKFWLYSGNNGMWIIGGGSAKEKQFDCSRGVIYSERLHGGKMPNRLKGHWLRLDKEAFYEDPDVNVRGKSSGDDDEDCDAE